MRVCLYLVSLLCLSATTLAAEVTHLNRSGALPGGLPFSEAVRVDDTLYLSGQIGMVPGKGSLPKGAWTERRVRPWRISGRCCRPMA